MLLRIGQRNTWVWKGINFAQMHRLPGSLPYWFSVHSHRGAFPPRADFSFQPVKPELPHKAGSKEGKIIPCLTFCKRHRQIPEVNHHEWSHLRVRPATPLCGWIARQSTMPAEETAGDSLCFVTLYDLPYSLSALHGNVLLCKKKQITTERRNASPAACY